MVDAGRVRRVDPAGGRVVLHRGEAVSRRTLDVSALPAAVLDSRSLVWWGTIVMTVIETLVFAITVAGYLYLRTNASQWPPARTGSPALTAATINLVVLLVSVVPAMLLDRAGQRRDLQMVRWMLIANLVFGTTFLVLRIFEFRALHCWWNSHAYGSITWTLLFLHTSNLLTSLAETAIVLAFFYLRKAEDRHYLDARLDGVFWYFIVVTWIPLYAVVFLVPRLH
jgi:heme/copper-type cytochrome/quinol oxidase subunit 3